MSNRKSLAAAFLLAGVFLFLALRGVDWQQVAGTMKAARPGALAIGCVWASTAILLRSVRWAVLLCERGKRVSRWLIFWATSVGYLGNHFLPARLGELMRTAVI